MRALQQLLGSQDEGVRADIKATQPNYPGTDLPRSFELKAGNTKVWVHVKLARISACPSSAGSMDASRLDGLLRRR